MNSRAIMLILISLLMAPLMTGAAPSLSWLAYDQGLEQARMRHKLLMVQVYADWCKECHRLSQDMRTHSAISRLLQRDYVLARLNLGSDSSVKFQGEILSEKQLAVRLQATWPPMLLFYTAEGRLIGRKFGYAPPEQMLTLLQKLSAGQPKS